MLQEMFGEDSVPKIFKGEKLYVTVDGKKANIDLLNLVNSLNITTNSRLHTTDLDVIPSYILSTSSVSKSALFKFWCECEDRGPTICDY